MLQDDELVFEVWMKTHNKSYISKEEKARRFSIFVDKLRIIEAHNLDPTTSYTMGVDPFSDLTIDEFRSQYLCDWVDTDDEEEVHPVAHKLCDDTKQDVVTPVKRKKAGEDEKYDTKEDVVTPVKRQKTGGDENKQDTKEDDGDDKKPKI